MDYSVATAYKFTELQDLPVIKEYIMQRAIALGVKGTIILASEGINFTVSAGKESLEELLRSLNTLEGLQDLEYFNLTSSPFVPFKKMKIRLKKEIVSLKESSLKIKETGRYLSAEEWNKLINQEDVILIDTRNNYEYLFGTFKGAINPNTDSFSDFPEWFKKQNYKTTQKIAMCCTGGIRCEKSTAYLKSLGFEEVYHLKHGILKYLSEVKEEENLWEGQLFVFDDRIAINSKLQPLIKE